MLRALFMADGSSDLPLATHIEALCRRAELPIEVVPLDPRRIPTAAGAGRTVEGRLSAALAQDSQFDCIVVHRDAEAQPVERRFDEVASGVHTAGFDGPGMAVVPIRMTEAWLLLDEAAIRRVAGRPSGTNDLGLPPPRRVEDIADPKAVLRDALVEASGASGRRLKTLKARFGMHRRQLLEALDIDGPVTNLSAWRRLQDDIAALARDLA